MDQRPFRLLGLATLSLAGILLEISLTRLFSLLYFYNYVFVILAVAVLGMGLGAAIVHQWGNRWRRQQALVPLAALAAAAAVVGLAWLLTLTVALDGRLLLGWLTAVPYIFIGMAVAALFAVDADHSPLLYSADLFGAALGAALAIPLLQQTGGLAGLLLVAALLGAASLLLYLATRPRHRPLLFGLAWLVVAVATLAGHNVLALDLRHATPPKPLSRQLQAGSDSLASTWDAFARVDVVTTANPTEHLLFIDGAAGSIMPQSPTDMGTSRYRQDLGYFPFRHSPERVFIIGPGGGRDVLYGRLAASREIVAAEISRGAVEMVRQYGEFNGRLYDHPTTTILVDEGRSALQRQDGHFDLIYLSEVVALAADLNSFVLSENYAFTREAFHVYLDHLTPDGTIALKLYDELTLTRAFVTAVTVLTERGLDEAAAVRHVVVALDPALVSRQEPLRSPLLLIYGAAVSPAQGEAILAEIQAAGFIPLFVPHAQEQPPLGDLTAGTTTLADLIANFQRGDVSPTRDAAPFFYEFHTGLPPTILELAQILAGMTAVALLYLFWRRRQFNRGYWCWLAYFALLGSGFMLVELALIQRLTLFLGHPTRALTVSLFALLLGGGLGSWWAGRLARRWPAQRIIMAAALTVAGLCLTAVWLLPPLLMALNGGPLVVRVGVAIVLLLPMGLALGMPFPLGLQRLRDARLVPLAWGVNGLMAVVGSTAVIVLALWSDFNLVLMIASLIYLVLPFLTRQYP